MVGKSRFEGGDSLNHEEHYHTVIRAWFRARFGQPTDVQTKAWQSIGAGHHTLISAPTGSGKTLAALLPCLDQIVQARTSGVGSAKGIKLLYITPLKALNNDIRHHSAAFAEELEQQAEAMGLASSWPGLTIMVRTGDTPSSTRAAILRRPPDVLVTTPESLFLMLTSPRAREVLRTVEQVIVDEIHSLAADRRGAHLSLSLERLTELCKPGQLQRIGVSATQNPMHRVAAFLGGWEPTPSGEASSASADSVQHVLGYEPRPVELVHSAMDKRFDVTVTMPDIRAIGKNREAAWIPLMDKLIALMDGARSVLVFANSRRLCERLTLRLNEYVGHTLARSHHGSMSKEQRLEVEQLLKAGQLQCLVATSSLELGIDIGHVDLVIQIDSPGEAAAGIQRIGRAGHSVGDVSRGVIVARHPGILPEAAVLARAIRERRIEEIRLPVQPMDVLTQQCVASVAAEDWAPDELYRLMTRSHLYARLPYERWEAMLRVLTGTYPFLQGLFELDRERGMLTARRSTFMSAVTGVGTIPRSSNYPVVHADTRTELGELDEEFVHESRVGDVFQLGTTSWAIRQIRPDRVYVSEAGHRFSEIPFWRNESPGRSRLTSQEVGRLLAEFDQRLPDEAEIATWLRDDYPLDGKATEELVRLVSGQHKATGLPTHRRMIVEVYRDAVGQTHIILHSIWGRTFNRTWYAALEQHLRKALPYSFYGLAKDNGIELIFKEWDDSWLTAIRQVRSDKLESLVREALPESPLFAITFRRIAETSLLLARSFRRTPSWQKRLRSEELLKSSLAYAEHFPYLLEAMEVCLHEHYDTSSVREVLVQVEQGTMEWRVVHTQIPSPLALQFIADYVNQQIYESDALTGEVQMRLLTVSKEMSSAVFGEAEVYGALLEEEAESETDTAEIPLRPAKPLLDSASLHAYLKQVGDQSLAELQQLATPLEELEALLLAGIHEHRIAKIIVKREERYVCSEELPYYEELAADASAATFVILRHMEQHPVMTEADIVDRYPIEADALYERMQAWEAVGAVEGLPPTSDGKRRWVTRKASEQKLRARLNKLRRSLEPADPIAWCGEVVIRQHLGPDRALHGIEGLRVVIGQLQGMFLPLSHWESIIFPSRLAAYRPADLDALCSMGEVIWLGRKEPSEREGKVAFFLQEEAPLYQPYVDKKRATAHPELAQLLELRGASFLTQISRDSGLAPSIVLEKLLDMAWEGVVSNDQFAPLRKVGRKSDFLKSGSGLGRWYLTSSLAPKGASDEAASLVHWVNQLLKLHGLITRDTLKADFPFSWDVLQHALRQMEEWGLVSRGMYLRGVQGMQYMLRETAEQLARTNNALSSEEHAGPFILVSSTDPANPFGWSVPWPSQQEATLARKPGNYLVFQGQKWMYWIENHGKRIVPIQPDAGSMDGLKDILRDVLRRSGKRKLVVDSYAGRAIEHTEAGQSLLRLGAERDRHSLVLWPSQLS